MSAAPKVRGAGGLRDRAATSNDEAPELTVAASEPISAKQAEKAIAAFLAETPALATDPAAPLREARDAMRSERKLVDAGDGKV